MIYELLSNFKDYAYFIECESKDSFISKYWGWKDVDLNTYKTVEVVLHKNSNGIKNYKFDVSTMIPGLVVLSENAVEKLRPILENYGQILDIHSDSKRKKFYGFFPNKNMYDLSIVNLELSQYREVGSGKIFNKVVFNEKAPNDDYIFTIPSYGTKAFVTEKFKSLVESLELVGFDFSYPIV